MKHSLLIAALVATLSCTTRAQLTVDYAIAVHSEVAGGGSNGIPVTPNFTSLSTTKATYVQWREALITFAGLCSDRGLVWNCECDWNFLEGVRRFELPGGSGYDATIMSGDYVIDAATNLRSTNTGTRNVMKWLREVKGVNLDPHSHETGGYYYADIAYLLDVPLDTEPTAVVGGHVYDDPTGGTAYQDWPKFLRDDDGNGQFDGLLAQRYSSTGYRWRPQLLMGGGTPSHTSDPHVSGLWKPTVPTTDHAVYFTHDPAGGITAVGNWEQDMFETDRLLRMLESGELPHQNKRWVVGRVFNHRDFVQPGYLTATAPALLDTVKQWRDAGRFTVRKWTEILALWDGTPSQYFRPNDNVSFSLNWQDFSYPEDSIAELRTLLDHHEASRVPVDVFFTTWQTDLIESMAPDLLGRLASSAWVSMGYHVRAPKPYANNYNWWAVQGRTLTATDITNYESRQLNMTTGESTPNTSGGYAKINSLFGYAIPVVGASNGNATMRSLIASYFSGAGAQMLVEHRDGVAVNLGERQNNVYLRPESYDWILIESFNAGQHLGAVSAAFDGALNLAHTATSSKAPYFVGVKLHDNDLFATQSAWTFIYQNGKLTPNWNTAPKATRLDATDAAEPGRRRDFYKNIVTTAASRRTTLNVHNVRDTLSLLASEDPRPIGLSVTKVNETAAGTVLAELSGGGIESGVKCSYALVSGTGSTDNARFAISGSNLVAATALDYETRPVNSIRVRWTDGGGNTGERALTLTLANVLTDDDDGDGFTEAQENLAGTNPLSAASRLGVTGVTRAGTTTTITWSSVAGKTYRLETSTDLILWETVTGSDTVASGGSTSITVDTTTDPKRFFRIKVL